MASLYLHVLRVAVRQSACFLQRRRMLWRGGVLLGLPCGLRNLPCKLFVSGGAGVCHRFPVLPSHRRYAGAMRRLARNRIPVLPDQPPARGVRERMLREVELRSACLCADDLLHGKSGLSLPAWARLHRRQSVQQRHQAWLAFGVQGLHGYGCYMFVDMRAQFRLPADRCCALRIDSVRLCAPAEVSR